MSDDAVRTKYVDWALQRVTSDARGDTESQMQVAPSNRFWLGRLTSEEAVIANPLGDRGERLDPCAIGISALISDGAFAFRANVRALAWYKGEDGLWRKGTAVRLTFDIKILDGDQVLNGIGQDSFAEEFSSAGFAGLLARIDITVETDAASRRELTAQLVNASPEKVPKLGDTTLYECSLSLEGLPTTPYMLEALPDSFRYDRSVPAYGLNCGVEEEHGTLRTVDLAIVDRSRPNYWGPETAAPDFGFENIAAAPQAAAAILVDELRHWGALHWSSKRLDERAVNEGWSPEMRALAEDGAKSFFDELARIEGGAALLESNPVLASCFSGMNRAIARSARGKYTGWRPFQFGFLLANLKALIDEVEDREIADVVWFSTGGGKTETYLGLLVTAALLDRSRGKLTGITAWSRFPLRMLSLQQTQRFADALAAAELVRQEMKLPGDRFSLGFFVGGTSTPNRVSEDDADDPTFAERYRVLERCPFCANTDLEVKFFRNDWTLRHRCEKAGCVSGGTLPFYVVDDEIYRFLPTVVVGTLDKAASIAMQASMRGFVGAPRGLCPKIGHGFTYAPRSKNPRGCLVPGCDVATGQLPQSEGIFAPSFRLQDELHLLRDSLGAIDGHYEALFDQLQSELGAPRAKILASSATLAGYEEQVDVLYRRKARVFPCPPPKSGEGFWARDTERLMRRYVAMAPRGVTIEFAVDRMLTVLQTAVRDLANDPERICAEIGVPSSAANDLISLYGTQVVYGNTLRDLEAVSRSAETQILVSGSLNTASLTGKTDFEDVRRTLSRLQFPEQDFEDRVHVVTASAMMSHGVDIDRLNVMVMMGIPLATAEFIQATARVGRTFPGVVFVMHKIGRERDASVFRAFDQFVRQGDRFLEPIPVTRHSRRVLERTLPGLALARVLMIYEPSTAGLTTPAKLRALIESGDYKLVEEVEAVRKTLALSHGSDEPLIEDIQRWFELWDENLQTPPPDATFLSKAAPGGRSVMTSLRDVETQVNIFGRRE